MKETYKRLKKQAHNQNIVKEKNDCRNGEQNTDNNYFLLSRYDAMQFRAGTANNEVIVFTPQ